MSTFQSTDTVVMVRPHRFHPNPETAQDNTFQVRDEGQSEAVSRQAYDEVTKAVDTLRAKGIQVHLFEDDGTWNTPDSVFPNNWFSTHAGHRMALYPMYAQNRRVERRVDIINDIKQIYSISDVNDYTEFEAQERFLEGTGAMVLDRVNHIAYVALSNRSNQIVLDRFCEDFGYRAVTFTATDNGTVPIYHTNVMMGIGTGYAVICLESIRDVRMCKAVEQSLKDTGHEIIEASFDQIECFAGNVLEVTNGNDTYLALSQTALNVLTGHQIQAIEKYTEILAFDIPTIERAGGSIRCMMAEIF